VFGPTVPGAETGPQQEPSSKRAGEYEGENDRGRDVYVAEVREAARKLVAERFLLPDDADHIVKQAADSSVLKP
jgi:hypothetical protein